MMMQKFVMQWVAGIMNVFLLDDIHRLFTIYVVQVVVLVFTQRK